MPYKLYCDQDYNQIKQQCLASGQNFVDDKFPPNESSISKLKKQKKDYQVTWRRPHEIIENPQFIVNGINPNDLAQGDTGDCWFISAASSLAYIPQYFKRVIPENQSFHSDDYAGIFHFRFWQFGEWLDVVVDDLLPIDEEGQLIYCHNRVDKNEFFGPLLEKAYAKLAGCYEFLDGGDPSDAMADLTGAICEVFNLVNCARLTYDADNSKELDDEFIEEEEVEDQNQFTYEVSTDLETLWTFILKSSKMNSLMNAGFDGDNPDAVREGLTSGHAYSVMQAVEFSIKNKKKPKTRLLKLRNPYGEKTPWKGQWSIESNNWKKLDPQLKQKLNLTLDNYGEFFMSFDDFIQNFHDLTVAHVNLDAYFDPEVSDDTRDWSETKFFGQWIVGRNSGVENYWNNTQYLIKVNEVAKDAAPVLVNLMQPYDINLRYNADDVNYHAIQMQVYSVECDESAVEEKILSGVRFDESELSLMVSTGDFASIRNLSRRLNLESGCLVLIPANEDSAVNLHYLIRFFFEKNSARVVQLNE